jgi:hypothetical protein
MQTSFPLWHSLRAIIALGACASALAQIPALDQPAPVGGAQPGGAPDWVKPGTRITYYASAASMRDGTQAMIKLRGEIDDTSASGQAFVQVNVVDLDRQSAVLEIRSYNVDVGTQQIQLPKCEGWTGPAHSGSDYWIHPAQLKALKDEVAGKMIVARAPFTLDGKKYNAIRIQGKSGHHDSLLKIYDLETGVLLFVNTIVNTAEHLDEIGGREHRGRGHMRLMSIRQVDLPWNGMAAPGWVGKIQSLSYGGTITTVVPGSISPRFRHSAEFKFNRTGAKWAQVTESSETQAPMNAPTQQATAERIFGTSQVGGMWVPPEALARLQPGILDDDRITRTQFSYLGTKGNAAYFSEKGSSATTQYAYDRTTGVLTELATTMPVSGVTMHAYVALQRQR